MLVTDVATSWQLSFWPSEHLCEGVAKHRNLAKLSEAATRLKFAFVAPDIAVRSLACWQRSVLSDCEAVSVLSRVAEALYIPAHRHVAPCCYAPA